MKKLIRPVAAFGEVAIEDGEGNVIGTCLPEYRDEVIRCLNAHADLIAALEAAFAVERHYEQCMKCGADLHGEIWHCDEYLRLNCLAEKLALEALEKAKE